MRTRNIVRFAAVGIGFFVFTTAGCQQQVRDELSGLSTTVAPNPQTPTVGPGAVSVPAATEATSTPVVTEATSVAPAATTPIEGPVVEGIDALVVLESLVVEAEQRTGYDRDMWDHWKTTPGGCSVRERVLIDESTSVATIDPYDCSLTSGSWFSVYDNVTTTEASTFDVDHVVALQEAHDSGGWQWDDIRRDAYANDLSDPRTLRAVTASSNRSKSAGDPSDWEPDAEEFRCTYVADHLSIKARWGLSVDADETRALIDIIIDDCSGLTVAPWQLAPATVEQAVLGER